MMFFRVSMACNQKKVIGVLVGFSRDRNPAVFGVHWPSAQGRKSTPIPSNNLLLVARQGLATFAVLRLCR